MSDDPLKDLLQKQNEHIARHEQLRLQEPFVAQTKRMQRLTEGVAFGLHSIWLMSTRCRSICDEFLTFRF
jgi:hypothetical protein